MCVKMDDRGANSLRIFAELIVVDRFKFFCAHTSKKYNEVIHFAVRPRYMDNYLD
jgi:hypothetical protein